MEKRLTQKDVHWNCRFHPTNGWHETGCPHLNWSKKDLLGALISKKKFEEERLKNTVNYLPDFN